MKHHIKAVVWIYDGPAAWYFVTVEKSDADEIKKDYKWERRGFGAIPVNVQIGKTKWKTSIFPEKTGSYVLPLKKAVRDAESIQKGDVLSVTLEVVS